MASRRSSDGGFADPHFDVRKDMTEMETTEDCTGCLFFKVARSGKHGYCHARPPQFTHIDAESGYPRFFFPVVSPHAWCGDWEQANAEG